MSASKRFTYRISGLRADVTAPKLQALLVEKLGLGDKDKINVNVNVRSLARTPDVWINPPRQTATFDFSAAVDEVASFELGDDDDPIIVDRDFLGFTPLNSIADEDHEFE
jgi:hypothetical protein